MCTAFIFWQIKPYRLLVFANRDEFHQRPTKSAHFWPRESQESQESSLLAGKDLKHQGIWLGFQFGKEKWGLITNYRESILADNHQSAKNKSAASQHQKSKLKSRGHILRDYFMGNLSAESFIRTLARQKDRYAGFNVLLGQIPSAEQQDSNQLWYFSNRLTTDNAKPILLASGCYGLSNHLLNSPWPKVSEGLETFAHLLKSEPEPEKNPNRFFQALKNRRQAEFHRLPDTGVGKNLEKILSSLFVYDPNRNYGTRSSVIFADYYSQELAKKSYFFERSYDANGDVTHEFSTQWPDNKTKQSKDTRK